jgi:hypothetical protein
LQSEVVHAAIPPVADVTSVPAAVKVVVPPPMVAVWPVPFWQPPAVTCTWVVEISAAVDVLHVLEFAAVPPLKLPIAAVQVVVPIATSGEPPLTMQTSAVALARLTGWLYVIVIVVPFWIGLPLYATDVGTSPSTVAGKLAVAVQFVPERVLTSW